MNVFESGIEQQIRDESFVDEKRFAAYIRKLNNEYGMHEQEAKEGICLWLQAYGISYAEQKEKEADALDLAVKRVSVTSAESANGMPRESDYEIEMWNGGVLIKKFKGVEDAENIIPYRVKGYPVKAIGDYTFYGKLYN